LIRVSFGDSRGGWMPETIESFKFAATSRAFPSEELVAELVGVDRRTVVRCKARLREWGWLDWRHEFAPRARWWHCVYELKLTWVAEHRCSATRDARPGCPRATSSAATRRPVGCHLGRR
jgi:hypothetical protein